MPRKDGTGPDGNGPKKVNPGTPTPRRGRKPPKEVERGRRNRGKVYPLRTDD